jgi:CheY-like chemotaxis protein
MIDCGVPATTTTTWRVLLVDDDSLVRDSVRRMLEFDHHKVTAAASAAEALALCDNKTFDLVLLDYLMPVTKGDELARVLKERYPNLPIIMITADAEKVESTEELPFGVNFMMAKPFQFSDLRDAINKMMLKA